jgi:hypothetical protein
MLTTDLTDICAKFDPNSLSCVVTDEDGRKEETVGPAAFMA